MLLPVAPRATTRETINGLSRLIAEGCFVDRTLPPERVLSERLGATRHAVRIALGHLAGEGAVHADGRAWRIGGGQAARSLRHGALVVLTDIPTQPEAGDGGSLEGIAAGALEAARSWATSRGQAVLCVPVATFDRATVASVLAERPCGVLVAAPLTAPARLHDALASLVAAGLPLAVHGLASDLPQVDTASSDQAAGGRALVGWLAARGCRRVLRGWGDPVRRGAWLVARDSGCRKACREHGLTLLPLMARLPEVLTEGAADQATFERQVDALAGLLASLLTATEPPDAMLGLSDRHAFQLTAAVRRFRWPGRPPLVCGYDDFWQTDVHLPWSSAPAATVDKRNVATGQALLTLLVERLAGYRGSPRHVLIEPLLIPTAAR